MDYNILSGSTLRGDLPKKKMAVDIPDSSTDPTTTTTTMDSWTLEQQELNRRSAVHLLTEEEVLSKDP